MIYGIIMALVIALDQITKYLIRANLNLGDRIQIIGDWFRITYVQNTGTAFSMFAGNKLVTLVLTSVLIIGCLIIIIKEARNGSKALALCLTAVISGGIANMIDRFMLGFVTDMISVGSFAVFNVADIAVTCGCFAAMILVLLEYRKEDK
ncbi:MAG: signal peptidase II [Clostridiales bacterium]|nr:signal peptidase II [Candidatus Crickella caballi]